MLFRSTDTLLKSALCSIVPLALLAAEGLAQTYPSRPIRIMIPSAQGAPSDVVTRLVAPKLAEAWGQPVIPENRAGATGMLALEAVAKAPPDGHTIVLVTGTNLTTTLMHQKFLLTSEFSAIGTIGSTPVVGRTVPSRDNSPRNSDGSGGGGACSELMRMPTAMGRS